MPIFEVGEGGVTPSSVQVNLTAGGSRCLFRGPEVIAASAWALNV